ncbi:MAG TPA: hypothetical protein VE860_25365, partial [Chthoniobacterales bacterium]|nr:hypothetical protein [Chthoniobacterales bacterium]
HCSFGATRKTIELSPIVGKSTVLSAADPGKQVRIVLALPLTDSEGAAEFVQRAAFVPAPPAGRRHQGVLCFGSPKAISGEAGSDHLVA